ncbi:MAG: hypothetical protein BM565_02480 [Gammaproteobacteria bacterium MedPE]|nr:MAG: hypothetical protein BM565_02480 [Gammaproteobacteria bacterium MedPE]
MNPASPIIIVSDIFGHNDYLTQFIADCKLSSVANVIDPYSGRSLQFDGQVDAYDCFTRHGGLDALTRKVKQVVSTLTQPCFLIGFSAGASAVWRVLADNDCADMIEGGLCFYPGQIRHHLTLAPLSPVELIFPSHETHFELQPVIESVRLLPNTQCQQLDVQHGFMNRQLVAFDEGNYNELCQNLSQKKGSD